MTDTTSYLLSPFPYFNRQQISFPESKMPRGVSQNILGWRAASCMRQGWRRSSSDRTHPWPGQDESRTDGLCFLTGLDLNECGCYPRPADVLRPGKKSFLAINLRYEKR